MRKKNNAYIKLLGSRVSPGWVLTKKKKHLAGRLSAFVFLAIFKWSFCNAIADLN